MRRPEINLLMKRFPQCSDRIAGAELFDERKFREMLDDPEQLAYFATAFPSARTLFEEFVDATRPSLPNFPADGVTALQFTLFDNGPQPSVSNGRMLTMKSQFALHIKAWDRLNIDWSKDQQIAWEATACLRRGDDTEELVQSLISRDLLSPDVATAFVEARALAEDRGLFGLCHQRKPGRGSHWTDVLAHVRWDGVSSPDGACLIRPDLTGYEAEFFEQNTASGLPLGGYAVAQARVVFCESMAGWATCPIYN